MSPFRNGVRRPRQAVPRRTFKPTFDLLEDRVQPSAALAPTPLPTGVVAVSTQELHVTRGGAPASFTVVLTSQPTAEVDITLAQSAGGLGGFGNGSANIGGTTLTIAPADLAFTTADWSTPQTVDVSVAAATSTQPDQWAAITGTTTSTDTKFNAQFVPPVGVQVTNPVQTGGVKASANSLEVVRGGPAVTYTIVLTSQPTANVTIAIAQGVPTVPPPVSPGNSTSPVSGVTLTVTPATLTFTAANWSTPQTVSVSAPAEVGSLFGDFVFLNDTVTSTDPNYSDLRVAPVTVAVKNNPAYGVVVSTDHLNLTSGGAAATYTIALTSQPAANVTITIAQDSPVLDPPGPGATGPTATTDPLTVTPSTLTFTAANWSTPQTVSVSAPAGTGNAFGALVFLNDTITSTDPNYNNLQVDPVTVTVTAPVQTGGVKASPNNLEVVRGGPAVTYTIALTSQPTADVTIAIAQGGPTVPPTGGTSTIPASDVTLTVTPATLTFTSANWSTPQTVSVSAPAGVGSLFGEFVFLNDTVTSTDPNYGDLCVAPVTVAVKNNPAYGVVVSTDHLNLTSGGAVATYTIALNSQPAANVTITITQDSPILDPLGPGGNGPTATTDPLTVTPSTLTFTAANWSTPQTVSVSAPAGTGNAFGALVFLNDTITSTDPNYNNLTVAPVTVTVASSPLIVLSTDHLDVTLGGKAATYTIALASQPTANVTITIAQGGRPLANGGTTSGSPDDSSDPLQISPTTLTFTSANWNTPQTVTVAPPTSGSSDQFDWITHTATSTDASFNNVPLPGVSVSVIDPVGLVFSKHTLNVTPGGTGDSYTIALGTQPTANVTVAISQSGLSTLPLPGGATPPSWTGGGITLTITPATLTFTPQNWNVAQTVTVTAAASTSNTSFFPVEWLTHTITSADPNYNNIVVPPVVVTTGTTVPIVPPVVPAPVSPPSGGGITNPGTGGHHKHVHKPHVPKPAKHPKHTATAKAAKETHVGKLHHHEG